jgi:thiol:disulfide interchange protein DsbG
MNRRRLVFTPVALAFAAGLAACSDQNKPAEAAAKAPAAKPSASEAYDLAKQGSGFTIGAMMAANTVYVFFDPACPHCAQLWMSAKPLLSKLKMVWMPIGLLGKSSLAQGATILAAPDPVAAMDQNEISVIERKGGITASTNLGEDVQGKVKANTELFHKLGAESVPFLVFRNAKNGTFGQHAGAVPTDQLAAMVGV